MDAKKKILLVEDEPVVALDQSGILKKNGYLVNMVYNAEDAITKVRGDNSIDLVLMDINLGTGMDGTDAARKIMDIKDIPIVFLTSHMEKDVVERVKGIIRYGYVLKYSGEFVLLESLHMAFELFEAHRREKESREQYQEQAKQIRERVKELNCLYDIAKLVETPGITIKQVLQGTVKVMPQAWQYPEITCARIIHDNHEYLSDDFIETEWKQSSPLIVNGEKTGIIEVFYKEKKPEKDEGPFLKEERRLMYAITERIGHVIERFSFYNELRESEERLYNIVEHMPVMMDALNENGIIVTWNSEAEKITGYSANEMIGNPDAMKLLYPDDTYRTRMMNEMDALGNDFRDEETVITCKDGNKRVISWSNISGQHPIPGWHSWAVGVDVTERNIAMEDLKRSRDENELRQRVANVLLTFPEEEVYSGVLDILLDITGSIFGYFGYIDDHGDLVSPTLTRDIWEKCQVPGKDIVFPRESWGGLWGKSLIEKRTILSNETLNVPEGHISLANAICVPIVSSDELVGQIVLANKEDGYTEEDRRKLESLTEYLAPIIRGWVEKSRRDEEIRRLLEEKEILLREVHHRIKNDMNSISSLLSLQSSSTDNPEASSTLLEARDRISVMGTIYDSLYMGRGFSSLSIKSFLYDLLSSIQQTYSGDVPVSINSRIEDIAIAAKQSFSLGIIINELVTNSYKYAFSGADNGAIDVVVEMTDDKTLHIIVSDTGQGMAADVVEKRNYGFGLTLVDLFVRQYKGTIDISFKEGTRVEILLPMLPVEKKG